MSTRTIQVQPKTLQGNITSSDVQFAIENFVGLDGLVILQADIGGTNDVLYGTFEPNTIREEAFSAKILSNVGTTVTFECTRGLIGKYPYSTGGIAYAHDAGSKVVFSNNPNLFNKFIAKDNTSVVTGDIQVPTPAGDDSVIPKSYADTADAVLQAQIDDDVVHSTGNEAIGGIKAFYSSPTVPNGATGTQAANANDIAAAVSGASGTATNSVHGTVKLSVAAASAPDPIAVGDNDPRIPTSDQTAALLGTSTPNSTNRFITEDTTFIGGDGSDGAATISSGTTTLTRDMYYTDLTVNGTGTLNAAGYRIYVNGTLTVDNTSGGGIINPGGAGGNASGSTAGAAGAAPASGTLPAGVAGVIGVVGNTIGANSSQSGNNGTTGTAAALGIGAAGATGGNGGAGAITAGTGGAGGAITGTITQQPRSYAWANNLFQFSSNTATAVERYKTSASGGSGGSGGCSTSGGQTATSGAGGGSGGSGGCIFIEARKAVLTGAGCINAKGGAGGNGGNGSGTGTAGGGGGGAGGTGGVVIFIYQTKTGTGTVLAAGGAGGSAGTSTGGTAATAGSTGTAGTVITIN